MRSGDSTQYTFKVTLKREKGIWRTLALRGDHTLDDLHEMIFRAFDRYDEHLYSFYFPRAPRRRETAGSRHTEYTSPIVFEEPDPFREKGTLDASEAELRSLKLGVGRTFEYLFDFGDSWWHQVKVVSVDTVDQDIAARLPAITDRHGDSPPQYPSEEE